MNKLISKGEQEFLGQVIKVIEGGFGENKRILFDTQIAQIHDMKNFHVRESIKTLIEKGRFIENVDYIDIKQGIGGIDTSSKTLVNYQGVIFLYRRLKEQGKITLKSVDEVLKELNLNK